MAEGEVADVEAAPDAGVVSVAGNVAGAGVAPGVTGLVQEAVSAAVRIAMRIRKIVRFTAASMRRIPGDVTRKAVQFG